MNEHSWEGPERISKLTSNVAVVGEMEIELAIGQKGLLFCLFCSTSKNQIGKRLRGNNFLVVVPF